MKRIAPEFWSKVTASEEKLDSAKVTGPEDEDKINKIIAQLGN